MAGGRGAWAVVITLLVILLTRFIAFEIPGLHMDEGVLLVYPEMILDGKLPYRDFETFYGPLNLWVLAGAYSLFGVHILVERGVALAMLVLLSLGVFSLTRRGGLVPAIASMALVALLTQIMSLVAFAWLGGITCIVWSFVLISKPGRFRAPGAGLLAAAGLLYRPDLGLALFAFLPVFLRMGSPARWRFAIGFCVGLLPLAVLTCFTGIKPVIENLFLYPVIHSNPGRRLPLAIAPLWVQSLFWVHLVACLVNLLAGAKAWARRPAGIEGVLPLSAGLLGLLITHQSLQRSDDIHVCMSAFFSIAILPWSLVSILVHPRIASAWRGVVASAAVVVIVLSAAFPIFRRFLEQGRLAMNGSGLVSLSVEHHGREYPVSSAFARRVTQRIVDILDAQSKPGERLFVGPADLRRTNYCHSYLYHLAPKLEPATYFIEMNPLSANRPDSRLADDISTADWLVLDDSFDDWAEPNASTQHGPDGPNRVIREQFRSVVDYGSFHILRRRDAGTPARSPVAIR